jgi:zinc transporter
MLSRLVDLPHDAHELFALREDRIQIVHEGDWVFGALPDLERDLSGKPNGEGRLIFAARGDRLITGRLHALRAVDDVRRAAERGVRLADPAALLAGLVETYLDHVEGLFDDLGAGLSVIEDYVLTEPQDPRDSGLAGVRRRLARYRREVQGLRSALVRGLGGRRGERVDILADHLPDLISLTEDIDREAAGLQDRARLLYEEIDTLINAATNRSMRTLTIISTLLIPPTLIVGAFGMNVPGIPWDKSPLGFSLASALCVAVVALALWLLRRMRMLP